MPFGTPPLGFSPSGGAPRSRGSKKKRCKSVAATTAASTTASAEREDAPTTGSTNKTAPEALPGPTVGGTEFAITRPGEGSIKTTSRGAAVFLVGEVECVLMTCTMCRCTFVSVLDGVPCCNRVDCVRATREMDWMRYKLGLGATHLPSAPWSARAAACTTSSKALLPARATTPTTTTQTVDKVAGPAAFVGTSPTPGEAEDMAAPSVIKAPTFSLSAATPPRRPDSRTGATPAPPMSAPIATTASQPQSMDFDEATDETGPSHAETPSYDPTRASRDPQPSSVSGPASVVAFHAVDVT